LSGTRLAESMCILFKGGFMKLLIFVLGLSLLGMDAEARDRIVYKCGRRGLYKVCEKKAQQTFKILLGKRYYLKEVDLVVQGYSIGKVPVDVELLDKRKKPIASAKILASTYLGSYKGPVSVDEIMDAFGGAFPSNA